MSRGIGGNRARAGPLRGCSARGRGPTSASSARAAVHLAELGHVASRRRAPAHDSRDQEGDRSLAVAAHHVRLPWLQLAVFNRGDRRRTGAGLVLGEHRPHRRKLRVGDPAAHGWIVVGNLSRIRRVYSRFLENPGWHSPSWSGVMHKKNSCGVPRSASNGQALANSPETGGGPSCDGAHARARDGGS
jgi:hypothetical protein